MAPSKKRLPVKAEEKKTSFLDLIPEIRNQIYELLLVDDQAIDLAPPMWKRSKRYKDVKYPVHDPEQYPVQLFRLNRQVHREASSIFYSQNTFQLSILYPVTYDTTYPSRFGGADNYFAVIGWSFEPWDKTTSRPVWNERTVLRWTYIMPSHPLPRSAVERKAKMGCDPTQIYWPAARYRHMVKKLRVALYLKDMYYGLGFPNWASKLGSFSTFAVRMSLAALFEGILQKADVEVNIVLPTSHRGTVSHGQASGSANEVYLFLKRLLMALAPLGTAKKLRVTTDEGGQKTITDEDCQKLRIDIRRYAKRNESKPMLPWRP